MTNSRTLPAEVAVHMAEMVEHLNANHADTIAFVVGHLSGSPNGVHADIVSVDTQGVDFVIAADGSKHRAAFLEDITTLTDIHAGLIQLITAAREAHPDAPVTSLEREMASARSLPTWVTTVAQVRNLSPEMREIVLSGGLADFPARGGDQFVHLMVATDNAPIPDEYSFAQWSKSSPQPPGAYYTVRRYDPDTESLTLWVTLHGNESGVGRWAATCSPGDRVAVWGPRDGVRIPPETHRVLLLSDLTGAAAVATLIDELAASPDRQVDAIIEIGDDNDQLPINERSGVTVEWRSRGTAAPGTSGELLAAVRERNIDPTRTVVFGAGEAHEMTAIRRYLRDDLGMSGRAVHAVSYWRRTPLPS